MKVAFLDLKRQTEYIRGELEREVAGVLASAQWIGGPYVARFEEEIAAYLSVSHAVGCGNGTDALTLALRACGVGAGDEVITSPFTFFATAEAISAVGAVPVFVDVREDTLNIDENRIKAAVTDRTKAILPVHIFGVPCEMDPILEIARAHDLKVIEDAAQAIGAEYKGRKCGTIGDAGCFSFYPTKNLGAAGDGGLVATHSEETGVALRAFREHGAGDNGARTFSVLYGEEQQTDGDEKQTDLYDPRKYYNYLIGYNSRLDAIQAAVLSVKLKHLDAYNASRARIASLYLEKLSVAYGLPHIPEGCKPCWHQFVIRTKRKAELCRYLGERGVGCGTFYPVPLHRQKAYEKNPMRIAGDTLPMADKAAAETVCLPIWPEMTEEEVFRVIECVNAFDGA